jgi:hypothetical protein
MAGDFYANAETGKAIIPFDAIAVIRSECADSALSELHDGIPTCCRIFAAIWPGKQRVSTKKHKGSQCGAQEGRK